MPNADDPQQSHHRIVHLEKQIHSLHKVIGVLVLVVLAAFAGCYATHRFHVYANEQMNRSLREFHDDMAAAMGGTGFKLGYNMGYNDRTDGIPPRGEPFSKGFEEQLRKDARERRERTQSSHDR